MIGLPSRDERGPVCFNCPHVTSPAECYDVTLCYLGESCYIEQLEWGDLSHYKLGCTQSTSVSDHIYRLYYIRQH